MKQFRSQTSHFASALLENAKRFPVLDDLTNCGSTYAENFRRPLHYLTKQLLGSKSEPQLGPEFDDNVNHVVGEIEAVLKRAEDENLDDGDDDESDSALQQATSIDDASETGGA